MYTSGCLVRNRVSPKTSTADPIEEPQVRDEVRRMAYG